MKKHIICFGDSNTHGYCADPSDCADGGDRFNEQERWTCLLQQKLGEEYLVLEEGLSGRTTVFDDPTEEGLAGIDVLYPVLKTHKPVDLLIVMLGTNDSKTYLGQNAASVTLGLERLLTRAMTLDVWADRPNILVIAPPPVGEGIRNHEFFGFMGENSLTVTRALAACYEPLCRRLCCHFLDAQGVAEFNHVDCMHLTKKGHAQLAQTLAELVPTLV